MNPDYSLELNHINRLDKSNIQEDNNSTDNHFTTLTFNSEECSICLDEIQYKDVYILPCLHIYHKDCISHWFNKKKEYLCPICRKIFGDYPVEPYIEENIVEERRVCFSLMKIETLFIAAICIGIFWIVTIVAFIYSKR